MRVAYFVPFRGGRETGIYRKVAEHCSEWRRLGADVGLFVGTGASAVDDWSVLPATERVVAMPPNPLATIASRESIWHSIRAWKPDVIYSRHGLVHPGLISTASRWPLVLEINSNDVGEFAAWSRWRSVYARTTRDWLLRRTSGLVCISHELARFPHYDAGPDRRVAIGNGIRLADFEALPAPSNSTPRIVFIGHPGSIWHGLDHLLEMATAFTSWKFDIIGTDPTDVPDAPSNVEAHGIMLADEYQPILERADVAVGSLALYRNGMVEGSPLKVREYLARGIPTIIGYTETDFLEPRSFLLQIPNAPDGVSSSLDRIDTFVQNSSNNRVSHRDIGNLDVSLKEAERLTFIEASTQRSNHV